MPHSDILCLYCGEAVPAGEVYSLSLDRLGEPGDTYWCHLPCFQRSIPERMTWLLIGQEPKPN
jgi:hypothetical protein